MRSMIALLILLLTVTAALPAAGQSYYDKETGLYVEFFGHGGEVSGNFEKIVGEKVAIRAGVGLTGAAFQEGFVTPFGVSLLLGQDRNRIELGIGGAYVDIDPDDLDEDAYLDVLEDQLVGTAILGYRFIGHYGFIYRLAFTPALTKDGLQAMGGAAFGYAF